MKRRLVILACLVGATAGGIGVASAAAPVATGTTTNGHEICLLVADNGNYKAPKYICVDTP